MRVYPQNFIEDGSLSARAKRLILYPSTQRQVKTIFLECSKYFLDGNASA
jgi:hypothetical protein